MAAVLGERVELDELVCPRCGAPVDNEPPARWRAGEPVLLWAHRDGSPLCGQLDGGPGTVEPIESGTRP